MTTRNKVETDGNIWFVPTDEMAFVQDEFLLGITHSEPG